MHGRLGWQIAADDRGYLLIAGLLRLEGGLLVIPVVVGTMVQPLSVRRAMALWSDRGACPNPRQSDTVTGVPLRFEPQFSRQDCLAEPVVP